MERKVRLSVKLNTHVGAAHSEYCSCEKLFLFRATLVESGSRFPKEEINALRKVGDKCFLMHKDFYQSKHKSGTVCLGGAVWREDDKSLERRQKSAGKVHYKYKCCSVQLHFSLLRLPKCTSVRVSANAVHSKSSILQSKNEEEKKAKKSAYYK